MGRREPRSRRYERPVEQISRPIKAVVFSPRPRDSLVPAQVERGYWGVHYDPANNDAYYSDEYGGTQDMKCGGGSGARANDGGKGGGMGGGFARAHCLEVQGVQG